MNELEHFEMLCDMLKTAVEIIEEQNRLLKMHEINSEKFDGDIEMLKQCGYL
jgi:hypothetical protein